MSTVLTMIEGLLVCFAETFTAGVIHSYHGQGLLEDNPFVHHQDPLEDFGRNDTIFQEYDLLEGDDSKMGWKQSRPAKWWMSLFKSMKYVFFIQILGGLAVGSLAILVLILDLNSVDLCFDKQLTNWTSIPSKIQAIIVTSEAVESYVIQLWMFLIILTVFHWRMVKKLNLLTINLFAAVLDPCYRLSLQVYGIYNKPWRSYPLNALFLLIVLVNSILIGKEIAKNSENDRARRIKKTIKITAMLLAQCVFGFSIGYILVYDIVPLYNKQTETNRLIIVGLLPLTTLIPKVVVRLAAQRVDFLHPGDSHVLLNILYSSSAIAFRVMQAELTSLKLYVLVSLAHGCVDLVERLTIVVRDYFWYYLSTKVLNRNGADAIITADKFRTPRSMRLIADMSIQMILGESASLIAAVGFFQLYSFMYNKEKSFSTDISLIKDFFIRIAIGLAIDFVFNSFSVWLQMSYLNIAVVRVWRKKWKKHLVVGLIATSLTLLYLTSHLVAVIRAKHETSGMVHFAFNCTGPFSRF